MHGPSVQATISRWWSPASPFNREEFDRGVEEIRRLGFVPGVRRDRVRAAELRLRATRASGRSHSRGVAGSVDCSLIGVRGGYGSDTTAPASRSRRGAARPQAVSSATATSRPSSRSSRSAAAWSRSMGPCSIAGCRAARMATTADRSPVRSVDGSRWRGWRRRRSSDSPRRGGRPAVRRTLTQLLASVGPPFAFSPPQGYVLFSRRSRRRAVPSRFGWSRQLRYTGLLARAAAVVIGELPRCDEPGR